MPDKINLLLDELEISYEPNALFQTSEDGILPTERILPKIQIEPESKHDPIFSQTQTHMHSNIKTLIKKPKRITTTQPQINQTVIPTEDKESAQYSKSTEPQLLFAVSLALRLQRNANANKEQGILTQHVLDVCQLSSTRKP